MDVTPYAVNNSPIDSLPDDILREILCCLVDAWKFRVAYKRRVPPDIRSKPRLRVAVRDAFAVCSRWKKTIDCIGECWFINLSLDWSLSIHGEENDGPDTQSFASRLSRWERAILNTANSCDLVVKMDAQPTSTGVVWGMTDIIKSIIDCLLTLETRHHQLQDLHFVVEESMMQSLWVPFCNVLSLPLPRLSRLRIESVRNSRIIDDTDTHVLLRTLDLSHARVLTHIHASLPWFCRLIGIPPVLHNLQWRAYLTSTIEWENLHSLLQKSLELFSLHINIDNDVISANPQPSWCLHLSKLRSLTLRSGERGLVAIAKALNFENVSNLDIGVLDHNDNGMELQSFPSFPKLKQASLRISRWTPVIERVLLSLQVPKAPQVSLNFENSPAVLPQLLGRPRVPITFRRLYIWFTHPSLHWRQVLGRMTFDHLRKLQLWTTGVGGLEGEEHNPQPGEILSMPVLRKLELDTATGCDAQNFVAALSAPELDRLIFHSGVSLPRPQALAPTPPPGAYSLVTSITFPLDFDSIAVAEYENPLPLFPNAASIKIQCSWHKEEDQEWTREDKALARMLNCLEGIPLVLPKLVKLAISATNLGHEGHPPDLPRCKLVLWKASRWRARTSLPDLSCTVRDHERVLWEVRDAELIEYDTVSSDGSEGEGESEESEEGEE